MALDEGDDVVAVVVGQPLSFTVLIGAKVFGSFFLGWFLGNLVEADLQWTLDSRADIPFPDLPSDIPMTRKKFGKGGAVFWNGQPSGHPVLTKSLTVLAHHQGTTARATGRVGDVGCGKAYPLIG